MRDRATFPLARRLREPAGAPLGEVFTFLSGLYFRGKLAYARVFARAPAGVAGIQVITPSDGLLSADTPVTVADLMRFGSVDIDESDPRYHRPLVRSLKGLASAIPSDCEVVMLGSIATSKYLEVLGRVLGPRLLFPPSFVGRGDIGAAGSCSVAPGPARSSITSPSRARSCTASVRRSCRGSLARFADPGQGVRRTELELLRPSTAPEPGMSR